jgi:hypothetical protein
VARITLRCVGLAKGEGMDRAMLLGLLFIGIALVLILDQVRTGGYYRTSALDTIEQAGTRVIRVFR